MHWLLTFPEPYLRRMRETVFSYEQLSQFTRSVFLAIGCSPGDTDLATRVLLSADIRGIDSHGIARLSGYVRLWEARRVNATPEPESSPMLPNTIAITFTAVPRSWGRPVALR